MGALAQAPGNLPGSEEKSNSNFKSKKSAFGGKSGGVAAMNGNGKGSSAGEGSPLDQQNIQAGIIRVFQNMIAKRGSSSQQDELPQPPNRPVTTQFESVRRQIALNNPGAQGISYVREF